MQSESIEPFSGIDRYSTGMYVLYMYACVKCMNRLQNTVQSLVYIMCEVINVQRYQGIV